MNRLLLTSSQALRTLLALLLAVGVFHLCVLFGIIPYQLVWAGRLNSAEEMYAFEAVSLLINLVLIGVLCMKAGYVRSVLSPKIIAGILWVFVCVFALNTLGNLFAESILERIGGTALTLVSAFLCWRIVKG